MHLPLTRRYVSILRAAGESPKFAMDALRLASPSARDAAHIGG